jgi:hypothetical protein
VGHTSYQTLINRARKAGLGTSELYSAMSSRAPEASDQVNGQVDSNGFTPSYNQQGHRIYQPVRGQTRT